MLHWGTILNCKIEKKKHKDSNRKKKKTWYRKKAERLKKHDTKYRICCENDSCLEDEVWTNQAVLSCLTLTGNVKVRDLNDALHMFTNNDESTMSIIWSHK